MRPPKKYHSASKTFDKSQLFCSWQLQNAFPKLTPLIQYPGLLGWSREKCHAHSHPYRNRHNTCRNSNEKGDFQFVSLEPGKYTLKVSHQEYSELAGIDFWVTRENLTRLTTTYIVCSKKRRTRRDRLPVRNPTRTRARFRPGSFRSTLHVPSIPHTSTTAGMMGHSGSA